jgi:hypothetical protein
MSFRSRALCPLWPWHAWEECDVRMMLWLGYGCLYLEWVLCKLSKSPWRCVCMLCVCVYAGDLIPYWWTTQWTPCQVVIPCTHYPLCIPAALFLKITFSRIWGSVGNAWMWRRFLGTVVHWCGTRPEYQWSWNVNAVAECHGLTGGEQIVPKQGITWQDQVLVSFTPLDFLHGSSSHLST